MVLVLKDGVIEEIYVKARDRFYFKVYAYSHEFPMRFSSTSDASFELLMSSRSPNPTVATCEQRVFDADKFYFQPNDANGVKWLYFTLYALEDLQIAMSIAFQSNAG